VTVEVVCQGEQGLEHAFDSAWRAQAFSNYGSEFQADTPLQVREPRIRTDRIEPRIHHQINDRAGAFVLRLLQPRKGVILLVETDMKECDVIR
jgi:hypothetical protein